MWRWAWLGSPFPLGLPTGSPLWGGGAGAWCARVEYIYAAGLGNGALTKILWCGVRACCFSPRLLWDSPFSIIKPRVPEASMNFKTFKNHWFYYAKLIEASSRLHRGLLEAFKNYWFYYAKLIEASSRLHRGFQKPLVLLYKTHRGSLEAFKNYWF